MRTLICYDISDDKRRRKVMGIMEGYGYRVQYSVFECDLDRRKTAELKRRLRPLVSKKNGKASVFTRSVPIVKRRDKLLAKIWPNI